MAIFSVKAVLPAHQHIRLLGDLEELGKWSPFESLELQSSSEHSEDCSSQRTWSVAVNITSSKNVSFRYFICENLKGSTQNAFSIVKCGPLQQLPVSDQIVGGVLNINDPTWCDGWLLSDTEIHLTIHNASCCPLNIFHAKLPVESTSYRIKIIAMDIDEEKRCLAYRGASDVKTKVVGEYHCVVQNQEESGVSYDPAKHYSFVTRVLDLAHVMFKVEIYLVDDQSVQAIGKGFIQPVHINGSRGIIDVGLVHDESPVGSVQVEYLVIKPLKDKCLHNINDWIDRNWENAGRTLNMGHRGCGSTFESSREGLQENTIESFLMAYEKGADALELDVHVTKDLQPVIYHDLDVKIPLQVKNGANTCTRMIPVHELTYEELQHLQIIHTASPALNQELLRRKDLQQKLFPTLEEVLSSLPENFPLELEVKYLETEKDQDDDPFLDVSLYVDTLLKHVFENMGNRKIVLMCFSPVIVQLLCRKQKKLPVKIGVCGETEKYPVYKDVRIRTIGRTVSFAESERLLGISCMCDHIVKNPAIFDEMKKRNLLLSTWGEDVNQEEIRGKQREMGVNVLCFDIEFIKHISHSQKDRSNQAMMVECFLETLERRSRIFLGIIYIIHCTIFSYYWLKTYR